MSVGTEAWEEGYIVRVLLITFHAASRRLYRGTYKSWGARHITKILLVLSSIDTPPRYYYTTKYTLTLTTNGVRSAP